MKVTDLTRNWTSEDNKGCMLLIDELDKLVEQYSEIPPDSTDILSMERIKRQMTPKLQRYAVYYSKIRAHFENNTYLNGLRKQVKAEAIDYLIKNGNGVTTASAERQVYSSDYYMERYELILVIRERFLLIDEKYRRYNQVERALAQSISVLNKEYMQNQ